MASEHRQELLDKANELGLEFAPNVSDKTLEKMIADSAGPAIKVEATVEESRPAKNKQLTRREFIAKRKAEAYKTRVVTITNKDSRDNSVTTTAHLSFENQFFGLAKNVPLDVPVELEQALIDIAESTMITQHRDEIVDGKRTGNKVPVSVKKYVVSYAKEN